jgi:hypothetical protein
MSSRKTSNENDDDSPPMSAGAPPPHMGFEDLFAPQPIGQPTYRPPRPPPMRPHPPRWRRNALAAAVLLGVGAGLFFTVAPARGWLDWKWLDRFRAPAADDTGDTSAGTGGSPLPETRSALPTPPPPAAAAPEPRAEEPEVPVEGEEAAQAAPAPKQRMRGLNKARRPTDRRRARGPVKLRPDNGTEVLLY